MAERDAALIFALLLTLLTALLTDADIVKVLGDRLIDLSDVGFLDIFDGWTNNRVIEGRENESDNFWTSLQILMKTECILENIESMTEKKTVGKFTRIK